MFRTIEIDLDVHKAIEAARIDFKEQPNEVLRRMLGIDKRKPTSASAIPKSTNSSSDAWAYKGVILPSGTRVRMTYNGVTTQGEVNGNKWMIEGSVFRSPSDAAAFAAKRAVGREVSLNGWIYWQAQVPGDSKWVSINDLRNRVN